MLRHTLAISSVLLLVAAGCNNPQPEGPPPPAPPSPAGAPTPEGAPTDAASPAPVGGNVAGPPAAKSMDTLGPGAKTTSTGLKYEDTKVGTGAEAKPISTVTVHYTGYLTDGTKFDSSVDRGEPFKVEGPIGEAQVIPGWQQGIPGMKVGGKRKLVIPSALAYGAGGQGPIPPNATLVFEIELLKVE